MSFEAINLRETRAWLLGRKNGLQRVPERALGNADYIAEARQICYEAVDQVVYSVPETASYERTGNLLESVSADSPAPGQMEMFIPLTPETAAIYGSAKGQATYAKLMLPGFKSFHDYYVPRDFLTLWHALMADFGPQMMVEEMDRELAK